MTDDKLKAGEVDSRPMQGKRRVNTVPDSPHGIEAGRPLSTIPDWIVEYDKKNFQSSAGKAIRILINQTESLQAENERLKDAVGSFKREESSWREENTEKYNQIQVLQSKLDRVIEYAVSCSENPITNKILDLLK
jgi:hypothetical protein